jgi:hypothetical protein
MRFTAAVLTLFFLLACFVSANRLQGVKDLSSSFAQAKKVKKLRDVKVLHPFDRNMVIQNHAETFTFDDANCQTAVCEAVDAYYAFYYEIAKSFVGSSMAKTFAECYTDCMGAYYGCSGSTLDSTCSSIGLTQSSCESQGLPTDDSTDDSTWTGNDDWSSEGNWTDDWTSTGNWTDDWNSEGNWTSNDDWTWTGNDDWTWTGTDDGSHEWTDDDWSDDDSFGTTTLCTESEYYDIFAGIVSVTATCGQDVVELPFFSFNASDLVMLNTMCTTNSDNDFCLDVVEESNAIYYGVEDCSYFYSYEASEDVCSLISDWGCCTGTLSMSLPPCVNQYLVDECGADLTYRCSKGMFEPITAVTTTIVTDAQADLTQSNVSDMYVWAVADGASADGAAVDMSYVSFNEWSSSSSRRLRTSDKRKLAGSTTMDVSINIVGDIVDTTDLVATVDSSSFNTAFESVVGSTITSKTAANTTTTSAEELTFSDDDLAFSPGVNMALVLASMFLGLALF